MKRIANHLQPADLKMQKALRRQEVEVAGAGTLRATRGEGGGGAGAVAGPRAPGGIRPGVPPLPIDPGFAGQVAAVLPIELRERMQDEPVVGVIPRPGRNIRRRI